MRGKSGRARHPRQPRIHPASIPVRTHLGIHPPIHPKWGIFSFFFYFFFKRTHVIPGKGREWGDGAGTGHRGMDGGWMGVQRGLCIRSHRTIDTRRDICHNDIVRSIGRTLTTETVNEASITNSNEPASAL